MLSSIWLAVLAGHVAAAAVWWWLMPGGFPSDAPELWVNQVAPLGVVGIIVAASSARGRLGAALLPPLLAAIPLFWIALAVSARITFPDSVGSIWKLPFGAGFALTIVWVRQFRFRFTPVWVAPCFLVPAIWAGWSFPGWQRAGDPTTRPAGQSLPELPAGAASAKLIRLSKDAQVHPAEGRVVVRRDKLVLTVQPLLSISSRSPDRCWTTLAEPEDPKKIGRALVARQHAASRFLLGYRDLGDREALQSVLEVGLRGAEVDLEARSRLPRPVFSHLSQFAELTLRGHHKLSVSFSPTPERRIEVPSATAPARFAYLDEAGIFHVVEASAQRHGPFTELAAGPLPRGAPLVLSLHDGETEAFRVSLDDWAAQASTQRSPNAGWQVPVNSIELVRDGDPAESPALISLSLASTSIGRASQSVGHASGVYRNRMRIAVPSSRAP